MCMPVLVPCHRDKAVRIVTRQERGEELALAAAPDYLDGVWKPTMAPLPHISDFLHSQSEILCSEEIMHTATAEEMVRCEES